MTDLFSIFTQGYSNLDEENLIGVLKFLDLSIEDAGLIEASYNALPENNTDRKGSINNYISKALSLTTPVAKSLDERFIDLVQFLDLNVIVRSLSSEKITALQARIDQAVGIIIHELRKEHKEFIDFHDLNLAIIPKGIFDLKQLRTLNLSGNQVSDIEGLGNLRNLENLDLGFNKIRNISTLRNIPSLESLFLNDNMIEDVHPLGNLKKLRFLYLQNNNVVKNLDSLATLPELEVLNLMHNLVNEDHVKVILAHSKVAYIYLMGTGIGAPRDIVGSSDAKALRDFYGIRPGQILLPKKTPVKKEQSTKKRFSETAPSAVMPEAGELTDHVTENVTGTSVKPEQKNEDSKIESREEKKEEQQEIATVINLMRSFSLYSKPEKSLFDADKLTGIFRDLIINSEKSEEQFFGLFGRWGRGKTYFWNLLKEKIVKENQGYQPIEFHAWKYQDTPAIWAYLYDTIANRYYNKPAKWYSVAGWLSYAYRIVKLNNVRGRLFQPIFALLWKIGIAIAIYLLVPIILPSVNGVVYEKFLGLCLAAPVTLYAIYEFVNKKFKTDAQQILQGLVKKVNFDSNLGLQHEIQKELAALLRSWIPAAQLGEKRILLFVDDIDRCSETKIIQIVDYIRVLLHHEDIEKRMTVLAAIDERILIHAIKNKYNSFIVSETKKTEAPAPLEFPKSKGKKAGVQPTNGSVKQEIKKDVLTKDERVKRQLCREYIDKLFIASLKLGPLTDFERSEIVDGFTSGITQVKKIIQAPVAEQVNTLTPGELLQNKTGGNGIGAITGIKDDVTQNAELAANVMRSLRARDERPESQLLNESTVIPAVAAPVTDQPPVNEYILEEDEQKFLKNNLTKYATDATPRSIRVYTLRYLLGKRLIEKPLREGNLSYTQWHTTLEGKKYFAMMLLNYSFDEMNNTDTLENDYKEFLDKFSSTNNDRPGSDPSTDYKRPVYDEEYAVRPVLASIIYQVLSMVVAY